MTLPPFSVILHHYHCKGEAWGWLDFKRDTALRLLCSPLSSAELATPRHRANEEICRDDVREAAVRIKVRMARTASDIIEIGKDLIAVKEALGHGQFLPWIEAEFGMSADSAHRFMNVADRLGSQIPHGAEFQPTALYALAAPSTPDELVEQVVARASDGETFTAADIKAMKAEWAAERADLKVKVGDAKDRASRADAIKQDFEQQLADLQEKLAKARDEADTLRHEASRRASASVPPPAPPTDPDGAYNAAPQRTISGRRRPILPWGCNRTTDRREQRKRRAMRGSSPPNTIRP